MADKDLFAPPTESELKATPATDSPDLFAAPSPSELMDKYKGPNALNDAIGDIPVVGKPLRSLKEFREDLNSSMLRGLVGGLGAKVEAGARAGAEKISGSDEDISALYDKYKKMVAQKQEETNARSPIASTMGKVAGTVAPAVATFGALGTAPMATEMAAGAVLGGAEGAGESNASDNTGLAKDIGIGAAKGAVGIPVAKVAGKVIGMAGEEVLDKLKESSLAKQLAATAINAAKIGKEKAGTLFGETGPQQFQKQTGDLSQNLVNQIEAPISQKNAEFGKAFKEASEQGKFTKAPDEAGIEDLQNFASDLDTNKIKAKNLMPTWTPENIARYKEGTLTPDLANKMSQELKQLPANSSQGTLNQTKMNLINSLTENANAALDNTTLQKLNTEKSAAWEASEPFIQKANKAVVNPEMQPKSASQMGPEQRGLNVNNQFENLIGNVGKSSVQGQKARAGLSDINESLTGSNTKGNLGLNPNAMTQAVQNQGYLSAANQNVSGIRGGEDTKFGLGDVIRKVIASPYKIAEKTSGMPAVQRVSKMLLEGTPEELSSIGRKLQQIPGTSHMGQALNEAAQSKDPTKMNAAIFTILQNPLARKAIAPEESSEGNSSGK